jgi:ribonuclease-3
MPDGMKDVVDVAGVSDLAGTLPEVRTCEQKLGYVFREPKLLQAALTHASGAPYRLASNERLEFLGDAILGMIICELLYHRYPKHSEGDLTKIKSVVVSRQTCARIARRLELDQHLVLGKGMSSSFKLPTSLLAGVFESLVAAIYLDGGMSAVRVFIERTVTEEIDGTVESEHGHNYKSLLQQWAQREYNTTPTYSLVDERGPDHRKSFKVSARIGGQEYAPAWGANKKEAEQKAALNALHALGGTTADQQLGPPPPEPIDDSVETIGPEWRQSVVDEEQE